jgi:hypothetical protein
VEALEAVQVQPQILRLLVLPKVAVAMRASYVFAFIDLMILFWIVYVVAL